MTNMTREQALEKLVELNVAKWGEGERAAARRLNAHKSLGLLMNSIAYFDINHIDPAMEKAAELALTSADRAELRKGG